MVTGTSDDHGAGSQVLRPRLAAFRRWDRQVEPVLGPAGPADGASAIEIPGRRPLPVRTHAEISTGPDGVVGRLVDPDGEPRPIAMRFVDGAGRLVAVEPAPAMAPAPDGVWTMDADGVRQVGADGTVRRSLALAGTRLLAAPDGCAWVLGPEETWHISAEGEPRGLPMPWRDPADVCVIDDGLGGWDPADPGTAIVLDADGDLHRFALPAPHEPFERPLRIEPDVVWVAALQTVVRRSGTGEHAVSMVGAGLTADGAAFFAGRSPEGTVHLLVADRPDRTVEIDESARVLAVDGEEILLWTGSYAVWSDGSGTSGEHDLETVTDAVAAEQGWASPDPYPFAMTPAGELLVAATGPDGIALLALTE